jgi:hypothetical protein
LHLYMVSPINYFYFHIKNIFLTFAISIKVFDACASRTF